MDIAESALITLATVLMVVATVLAIIPILPGTLMVWGIGIVTGILEGFQRVTPFSVILMTLIMAVAVTSDFWLPYLGVKTRGLSCLAAVGSLIGGLIGTFVIPVPVVGTLIGTIGGALVVELVLVGEFARAMRAGRTALKLFLIGYAIELTSCLLILAVFVFTVWSHSP